MFGAGERDPWNNESGSSRLQAQEHAISLKVLHLMVYVLNDSEVGLLGEMD